MTAEVRALNTQSCFARLRGNECSSSCLSKSRSPPFGHAARNDVAQLLGTMHRQNSVYGHDFVRAEAGPEGQTISEAVADCLTGYSASWAVWKLDGAAGPGVSFLHSPRMADAGLVRAMNRESSVRAALLP